jgi:hypothetical protein
MPFIRLSLVEVAKCKSAVIFFRQKPVIKDVMGAVKALAERLYGPRQLAKGQKAS